jgi:RsiW-degrading membrane proteinase PrsW (M82 family)
MDMKKQINMCLFMFMLFILIQIKFNMDKSNDELLKNIQKHKKRKKIDHH